MKILLINPPSSEEYVRVDRCMQKRSSWAGSLWPPLELMYAQAILDENGYETKLKDTIAEKMGLKKSIKFIIRENPDVLVVNTAVPTIFEDFKFVKEVKKELKEIKTVAIGPPTSLLPDLFLKSDFDYAIVGDVEYAILDILKNRRNFVFKKIGKTLFFKHYVDNLDKLPFPALYDLNLDKYTLPFTKEKLMLVNPARGCPFECIFCIAPLIEGKKVRFRSPKNFVDEIERDYYEYGIKNFLFWTENFTLNKKFAISVSNEIIERGLEIKWMTPSRVDSIDKEIMTKMKRAGCWMVSYGIESINQKVLDVAKKHVKIEQIEKAVKLAHDVGIKVVAHIIIGLPHQTWESVKRTVEWLIKKKVDYAQFYCAVPYWKTELRKIAEEKGWIESNDPRKYEIDKAVMRNESLSTKEIEKLRRYAYFKFYLRPEMIFKELVFYRFNPLILWNLINKGIYFLKNWVLNQEISF